MRPVHKRLTFISAAVCGGVALWAATLAYLTYRVCLASGGVLADSIFRTYVVPFEVVSILLLASLVGAIVLARRD